MRPLTFDGLDPRHVAVAALLLGLVAVPAASASYHGGGGGGGGGDTGPFISCSEPTFSNPSNPFVANERGADGVEVTLGSPLRPFSPATLVVDAGTCVQFTNEGPPHSVRVIADSEGHTLHTIDGDLQSGESTAVEFQETGVYELNCGKHPTVMHQVLQVV